MKKKILVLGLILAAAFVLFTSCEGMLSVLPGESFTISSNETTLYGPSATLRITNYNKVLGMGFYNFNGVGVISREGIIKVNKILRQVELKEKSGSTETISISGGTIKIGSTAKQYTFDINRLLK